MQLSQSLVDSSSTVQTNKRPGFFVLFIKWFFFLATRLTFCRLDEIPWGQVPEHNRVAPGTCWATDTTAISVRSASPSNLHMGPGEGEDRKMV